MGLLDEAIREHLALKRGRGADPAEIAREEKEALGPPTRSTEPQAPRAREDRGESEEAALDEPATGFAPADAAPQTGGEPRLRLASEPRLRITEEDLRERASGAGASSPPPVAPVDDAPAVHDEPVAPAPAAADDDPPSDRADADDELHTDDFVFDDEDEHFFADELDEPRADEPLAPPAPAPLPSEPPLEPPTERYAPEDVEDATRRPEPPAPDPGEEDEPEGEELLEETPEFLEETPEHDRLWFEQKPPRDFDF